jgi:two-component system response regulator DegU
LTTGHHFTERISRAMLQGVQQPTRPASHLLTEEVQFTPRELEVLRLICQGLTAADIAEQLLMGRRTVEGHRQRMLEKTGAANVAGLVVYAVRHGLLDA